MDFEVVTCPTRPSPRFAIAAPFLLTSSSSTNGQPVKLHASYMSPAAWSILRASTISLISCRGQTHQRIACWALSPQCRRTQRARQLVFAQRHARAYASSVKDDRENPVPLRHDGLLDAACGLLQNVISRTGAHKDEKGIEYAELIRAREHLRSREYLDEAKTRVVGKPACLLLLPLK